MTFINDTWRFLVQRRLLPVVIVLIAAAAAVPMLLAKDPVATPAPSAGAAVKSKSSESALTSQPIVALAGDGDRAGRRRVLGSRKNPFEPQATPAPTPSPDEGATAPDAGAPDTGKNPSVGVSPVPTGGGGGAIVPPSITVPGQPGVTAPEKKRYELFELTVRFGASDSDPARQDVKRLEALPSAEEPVLIYLGVLDDKKTAVFLVDSGAVAQGDGTCRPSRNSCDTIHLREGETEFFDVLGDDGSATGGQQYQLDLVKIRRKSTKSAKQAKRSLAKVSKAGKKILRARIAGDGPLRYRFDRRTGRLHKLSKKSYRAAVAKAAKAARARF